MSRSSTIGAQSLPPEILKVVLGDVVHSASPEDRPWTALSLTHVCQYFRHVALEYPQLWTCLSRKLSRPGLALIEACIERSRDHPLDVVLHVYGFGGDDSDGDSELVVDSMARTVLPLCSRWRSYSVRVIVVDHFDNSLLANVIPRTEFRSRSANLDAPMLEEFSIEEESNGFRLVPTSSLLHRHPLFPLGSFWNLPALHTLTLRNTLVTWIPSEFRKPLRSASLSYVGQNLVFQLNSLRLLAIAASLTTLRLSFVHCLFSNEFLHQSSIELLHVKSLRIDILGCSQLASDGYNLWRWFHTLGFPNVVDLTIFLDIGDKTFQFELWYGVFDLTLHSFLMTGIDPPSPFPCLETLDIEVYPRQGDDGPWPSLLLPHRYLSSLKHLRIRSTFNLKLSNNVGDFNVLLPKHFTIGPEVAPIALQSVTFEIPEVDGIVHWMRDLRLKMHSQHYWDGFIEFTVKNGENEVQVIPRDEVERWCNNIIRRV